MADYSLPTVSLMFVVICLRFATSKRLNNLPTRLVLRAVLCCGCGAASAAIITEDKRKECMNGDRGRMDPIMTSCSKRASRIRPPRAAKGVDVNCFTAGIEQMTFVNGSRGHVH